MRVVIVIGWLMPRRFRGTSAERRLRDYVVGLVDRCIERGWADHDNWVSHLQQLHDLAVKDELLHMGVDQLHQDLGMEQVARSSAMRRSDF